MIQPTSFYSTQDVGMGDPDPDAGPTKSDNVDMTINFSDFYNGIVPNDVSSCIEMIYDDFLNTGLQRGGSSYSASFQLD